ncbi:uncharacterized protein LOC124831742 [Vigna umbellata]|uniref:uncharacterized protein LOC124831740 n=1 Tax=Vigna umbellata TaxID=87088 RepID=UPI001F5FC31A|nr:uncharacterized protein LOC124831740 [Vigna umbellata]XP_047161779.1 uncharacterized protein LOC124831742 [Vigna umbellata]
MNNCTAGNWIGLLQLKRRSMAILPSLAVPSTPTFRVKLFQCQPCQFHRCSEIYFPRLRSYNRTRSFNVSMAEHNEPNEVKMKIGIMREKLKGTIPVFVQEFPWKKAEHIFLEKLFNLAQEAGKWSLVLFLIYSFVSDVVYTLSINRELIIPIGLFAGCLVADFLKEISQELFHRSEEKVLKWRLLGMYFIFVFVKIMSSWFATLPRVFLLHVGSGGLMQVLWHWRNLIEDAKNQQENSNFSNLETS